jgi:hypothetical protein
MWPIVVLVLFVIACYAIAASIWRWLMPGYRGEPLWAKALAILLELLFSGL